MRQPEVTIRGGTFRRLLVLGVVLAGALVSGQAQVPSASQPSPGRPGFGADPLGMPDAMPSPASQRRLEHMREDERQKRLAADVARLVQLTNELKVEVEKTTKDQLSLDVVRKAAEIEKLAHDVKERMKS